MTTLRGQTVHWIGAQFSVYRSLESRDKSLNMLKFCRNLQRKGKNKGRFHKKVLFCGIRLNFTEYTTVGPRSAIFM